MSTSKRIISLLLALVMVLGMLPWDTLGVEAAGLVETVRLSIESVKTSGADLFSVSESSSNQTETTTPGDTVEVTRAQWIQELVAAFGMTVQDGLYPDNYYTDISEDDAFYYDILLATEFGVIDLDVGLAFRPNDPATREFAAQTLNFCLAFRLDEDAAYTFSDVTSVAHPEDAQVAVNRSWFALIDGAFMPDQPITSSEMEYMLEDAVAVLSGSIIDENYNSTYSFAKGIIVIPEGTVVSKTAENEITIEDSPANLKTGDLFAVYLNGIPCAYSADAVLRNGNVDVVKVTQLSDEEAYTSIDAEGAVYATFTQIEPAEGTEVVYIIDQTGEEFTDPYEAELAIQAIEKNGTIKIDRKIKTSTEVSVGDGVTITVSTEFKNPKFKYSFNLLQMDAHVSFEGDADVSYELEFDTLEAMEGPINDLKDFRLLNLTIPHVGGLVISLDLELKGSIKGTHSGHMLSGYEFDLVNGGRLIKDFDAKSFALEAEASGKLGIEVKLGLTDLPVVKGYLFAGTGAKASMKVTDHLEGLELKECVHFSAHWYVEYGAKAEIDFFKVKKSFEDTHEYYNESNSPIRIHHHYEDGVEVPGCTRDGSGGSSYSNGWYTTGDSRYWGSGWGSGSGGGGFDREGNPIMVYTYSLDENNNATITGYKGNSSALTIPETIDGYAVTAIGANAFKNKTSLRTVLMQDNILTIGESAFYGCNNLRNLTLSDSLTAIGNSVFRNCTSLTTIDIPDATTSIGIYAFSGCSNLVAVSMPDSVSVLGSRAFYNCTSLTTINYPRSWDSVIEHDHDAWLSPKYDGPFAGCIKLSKISIPDGVTAVPAYAFCNCTGLKNVSLPESLTSIQSNAFAGCTSLTQIHIPNSVLAITGRAFYNCTNLAYINIPRSWQYVDRYYYHTFTMKSYYDGPFSGCSNLTAVTFPAGMESVPKYAFQNCTGLQTVELPESIAVINSDAFSGCTNLQSINIPNALKKIDFDAFYACSSLQTLILPSGLTTIGENAFRESGLVSIEIPDTVTSVGTACFRACTNLDTVIWTDSVTTIPEDTFYDCTSLSQLTLPDSVKVISSSALCNCDALVSIDLPASLTTIKSYAFIGCDALETLTIPDKVTTIGQQAFDNCSALRTVRFPNSLRTISTCAFYDCDALTEVLIPYGVTTIESKAFYDCDALEKVEMANSVISLGSHIFYHCDLLKDVSLSRNLKSIPTSAFQDCPVMEEIVIPYFTTSIGDNAFNSNVALTKIVTHENLTSISTSAFSYADWNVFYGTTGSYTESWCADNGYTFVENIAVTTKVTPAETEVSIPKGKTYMLDFDIDPIDFHEVITTKSSNTAVATVDETGKITAVAPGTATIKIIVGGASASCKITVTQGVTKITLNKTKLSLEVPETYQLTATITPSDASNKTLKWTSSNESAATVDENGLVTAVGNGTAVIKAEATDGSGISVSCTVTVIDPSKIPVSGITLDKTALSLEAMETYQLTAAISPTNAANKDLIWTSSNEAVATVDSNGRITAVAKGTATITATAADGYGASASCTVTVTNNGYVVTALDQFQSSHPYENSCRDFWLYTQSGAGSLSITFAAETEIEDGFDYLYIYDGEENLIGKYTGTELAGQTITIPGDTVKVQLESDDSGNAWGFRVTDVDSTDHTHSFTNYVSDGNATCTEDGTKTAKCDHCDATDTIPDAGSALGHVMGSWETTVPVTCTENGEEERNCSRCDHSESRVVEAVGHRWDKGVVTREPTEDTEGERLYTCTACGATRTESIPVIGHEHRYEAVVTAPTCTERGYTTYTCKCGESYVADYVDALGHDFGEWELTTAATCTENGEERRSCSRCDHSESRTVEATGHSYGDWTVIQEPTTTEEGLEERSCTRCGHTEQRSIAKLENPFTDVQSGSFYYEPVMWAIENGITNGTSANTFGPNDQCMRAHVVTFLWRAVGSPEPTRTDNPFVDVKPTDFYYKPVLWAVENGITSGMDATHFGPTAYCNRAQVVTFLYRTMGNPDVGAATNPFADVAVGSFYEKPVLWAVENGVTAGMSATSFGPNSICNRAQIVTFLYRAFVD